MLKFVTMQIKRKQIVLFLFVAIFSLSLPTQIMCWVSPQLCNGMAIQTSLGGIIISVLLAAVTLAYYVLSERKIMVNTAFFWLHWAISLVGMIVFKYGAIMGINPYTVDKLWLQIIIYGLIVIQILFGIYFFTLIRKK